MSIDRGPRLGLTLPVKGRCSEGSPDLVEAAPCRDQGVDADTALQRQTSARGQDGAGAVVTLFLG